MAKILVIDDEADMRFAVRMLLERSGHSVIEAGDGDIALGKLEGEAIDLVLLDMRLPGMDGIQILEKIREKRKDVPVIMVTGYGNVELADQALKLGADHYLSKPFHNKELIDVIHSILEKRGIVTAPPVPAAAPASDPAPVASPSVLAEEQSSLLPAESQPIDAPGRDFRRWAFALGLAGLIGILLLVMHLRQDKADFVVPYSNPSALIFTSGNLWVADWFSQSIYVHDLKARDFPVNHTYYLPDIHLTGMALAGDSLYTADSWTHTFHKHRLDEHLTVLKTIPSPGDAPCALYWDGNYLWSCDLSTGKIYQHQMDDRLTVVATFNSPGQAPVGFYKDDRYGWSLDSKMRKLYQRRLDNQLTIVGVYQLPEWEEGSAPLACFTWRGDELWFARTGKSLIHRRKRSQLVQMKDGPAR